MGVIDPDVDPVRPEPAPQLLLVVLVVAAGGMVGAVARYGLVRAWPGGTVPWSTLVINAAGGLLIGALLVVVTPTSLTRAFAGTGVLGGFTTFSAYAEQTRALLADDRPLPALAYLFGTLAAAVLAVHLGAALARKATR